jgi:hypothetical protein
MSRSTPRSEEAVTATSAVYKTSSETAFRAALVNRNSCKGMESSVKKFRGDMGLSGNDLRVQPDLAQKFCALVEASGNAQVHKIFPRHSVVEVTSRPPFEDVRYFAHAAKSKKSMMVVSQIAEAGVFLQQRYLETFATFIALNQDVPSVSSLTGCSSKNTVSSSLYAPRTTPSF